jgi:hypothetical protein
VTSREMRRQEMIAGAVVVIALIAAAVMVVW